jgi:short-subunit dehydrogenase
MNKLIVVTGGTKGIGRAVNTKFAAAGYDLITCSRNPTDLENLKKDLEQKFGIRVHIMAADLSRREDVNRFIDYIKAQVGEVDVLVNNSGVFIPGETLQEPDGTMETMMESNLYSAYYLTRGIIGLLLEKGKGHIFNLCSVASIKAYPNGGSYSISKFALLGFTKVLREELKSKGIRVTAVIPGATLTASWAGVDLPEERFMRSEDVAEAIFSAVSLSDRTVLEEIILRPQLGDL